MNSRLIKVAFTCAVTLYIVFVCFNNISDYRSNFGFVSMVAKMDDTFSKARNGWRSIHNPVLHHFLFLLIIAWEVLIAILLITGASKMIRGFRSPAIEFKNAKKYAEVGLSLGVLLW